MNYKLKMYDKSVKTINTSIQASIFYASCSATQNYH